MENYVLAQPEKLWSKLAAERVLRPHVLSTVAAGYAHSEEGLHNFFGKTFYAHQYGPRLIRIKIGDILQFLVKQKMVTMEGKDLEASKFGKRVSELSVLNSLLSFRSSFSISRTRLRESFDVIFSISLDNSFTADESASRARSSSTVSVFFSSNSSRV